MATGRLGDVRDVRGTTHLGLRCGRDELHRVDDACTDTATDEECATCESRCMVERSAERRDDVVDIDVVADELACAVDRERVTFDRAAHHQVDHTAIGAAAGWPRTVDVAQAQHGALKAATCVELEVLLGQTLVQVVDRDGMRRDTVGDRHLRGQTEHGGVNRRSRRCAWLRGRMLRAA